MALRVLPLGEFITGVRRTALRPGELVSAILVPPQPDDLQSVFLKAGARKYLVISIAMVSVPRAFETAGSPRPASLSDRARPSRSAFPHSKPSLQGHAITQPLPQIKTCASRRAVADFRHARQRAISQRGGGADDWAGARAIAGKGRVMNITAENHVAFTLNGERVAAPADAGERLSQFLRERHRRARGQDRLQCRRLRRLHRAGRRASRSAPASCPAHQAQGRTVDTVEGAGRGSAGRGADGELSRTIRRRNAASARRACW